MNKVFEKYYLQYPVKQAALLLILFCFSLYPYSSCYSQKVGVGSVSFVPLNMLDVNGNMVIGSYAGSSAAPANSLAISGNIGIGTTNVTDQVSIGSSSTNHLGFYDGSGNLGASMYQNGTNFTIDMPGASTDAGANFISFTHTDPNKVFFGDDGTNTYIGSTKTKFSLFASSTGPSRLSGAGRNILIFQGSTLFMGIGQQNPTSKVHVGANLAYDPNPNPNGGTLFFGCQQLRLRTTYTPTGSADANGNVGDTAWDDNYFYIKTSVGWKRAALAAY